MALYLLQDHVAELTLSHSKASPSRQRSDAFDPADELLLSLYLVFHNINCTATLHDFFFLPIRKSTDGHSEDSIDSVCTEYEKSDS